MKYIRPNARFFFLTSFVLCLLGIFAAGPTGAETAPVIKVGNIEELYGAVNDPANVGSTIILAPGVYTLSANSPEAAPRPNRGRLELQENMSLLGAVGDRNAVVIDAANLPDTSYAGGGPPLTGAIRIGRGINSIEWLTVKNAINGSAGIETDLIWPGTAYVRIAHIATGEQARGLDVRNFGPAASGAVIEAELVDNEFFNNKLGMAEGLRIGNFQGATGSTVNARMVGNRSYGNEQGRLIVNNRAISSTVNVVSIGNRFFNNGSGTIILGGLSSNATPANGNSIVFEGHGDRFEDNQAFAQFDVGGLVVVGGENTSIPNGANNNTVHVRLWGCRMSNNQLWDLGVIGARSVPDSIGLPGTNNTVTVELNGAGNQPFVQFLANSIPFELAGTNRAAIIP
jgi:hypothetical protein